MALLGAALVLIAAGIVVASNWDASGPALRFAAILLVTAGLTWTAERLRPLTPTTSGVIAHLGAFLAAPVGVAGVSMLGATWPLCLVVGGALAIGATEVQGRRWQRSTLHAGQVVAWSLAATGLAALSGTTAGLVAGVAAIGLMLARAHRRSAGLAIVAVLSPILWALADTGIGAGTFERAGMIGDRLGWSGPVVGVLAATVLAITARRYRSNVVMVAAAAAPVLGAVTGLAATTASVQLWWTVPALVVMAAEAAWWLLPTDRHRAAIGRAIDVPAVAVATFAVTAPLLVALAGSTGDRDGFAVPAAASAVALWFVVMRWRRDDRFAADLGLAAIAGCVVACVVALDAPALLTAAIAVGVVAVSALSSRSIRPIAVHVPAWWAVAAIAIAGDDRPVMVAVALGLLTSLTALVVWLRARAAGDSGAWGWVEMLAVTAVAAVTAAVVTPWSDPTTFLVAAASVIALVVTVERRFHLWACAAGGVAAVLATGQAVEQVGLEPTLWIGWSAITLAIGAVGRLTRSTVASHAAASAGVVTLAVAAAGAELPSEQLLGLGIVAVVVLSGLAFTIGRRTQLDAAAATAGILVGLFSGLDVDPLWVSFAWFVLGVQIGAYGVAARQPVAQVGGSLLAVGAAVSAWFTSGANAWLLEVIEPAGVTAVDLWMLIAVVTAFAAGVAARRTLDVSSWLAYTGGLVIAGIWLTSVQLDRETVWAIPLAVTVGAFAAGIGAWRRLAAPLVGGVALITTTVVVAAGRDLTELPTWTWLAAGGLGLLATAVLIERAAKRGPESLKELAARWH